MSETKIKLISAILSLVAVILTGTLGLSYVEGMPIFDSLWVTIISLTTTGYGDILPKTMAGRSFLLFILVLGVGIVAYSLSAVISILVEAQITRIMERNKMSKEIQKLRNHIIVCGSGRVGQSVVRSLKQEGVSYVVIDFDEELINRLQEEGHLAMVGDATNDEVLLECGIKKARGVVCALSSDAYNVFVVLSARAFNPNLKIVARAEKPETIEKLRRAGANKIISPALISGHRMAMAMLKPVSVDLVDTLFTANNMQFQLEEVVITDKSLIANKKIKEVFKRDYTNVIVVAIIRNNNMDMNPKGDHIILPGDTVIMLGSRQDLEKMERTTLEG